VFEKRKGAMLRYVTLVVVAAAAPALADGSYFAPLFTAGNTWTLTSDTKVPFTVHATIAVRALKAAQVASVTFTADPESAPRPDGDASPRWVPTPLCLARSAAGLFVVDDATCSDKAVLRALKGKPVMADPPKAFTREVKGHADDVPLKESVEIAIKPVLDRKLKVASYAFSQDSGFTMALAEDVGFVSLGWDLQDGGGSFALTKFDHAAPATPAAAATWEQLGIDAKGRAALEAANGALSVSGEIAHETITISLRGTAAQTELVVTGSEGKEQFSKAFKKRPPRGLRYEPATGEVSLFFDLGPKLEQTAKTLKWNPHSHQYLISAHTDAAE
jgi:hypothetical protein